MDRSGDNTIASSSNSFFNVMAGTQLPLEKNPCKNSVLYVPMSFFSLAAWYQTSILCRKDTLCSHCLWLLFRETSYLCAGKDDDKRRLFYSLVMEAFGACLPFSRFYVHD